MNWKIVFVPMLLFCCFTAALGAEQGDRFVYTQLKYDGDWDPYPFAYKEVLDFFTVATSVRVVPERRVIDLDDKLLFSSPFVVMLNNGRFGGFTEREREILRQYIENGGTIFIEDSLAQGGGRFDSAIRGELAMIYPGRKLARLRNDNVIYRTFYLLRHVTGRRILNNYIEGLEAGGRTAIFYSQNDIFGAWARDNFGNYFFECSPGGEKQRFETQKLTVNILVYTLTGTYKDDPIHRPFIKKKLGL